MIPVVCCSSVEDLTTLARAAYRIGATLGFLNELGVPWFDGNESKCDDTRALTLLSTILLNC